MNQPQSEPMPNENRAHENRAQQTDSAEQNNLSQNDRSESSQTSDRMIGNERVVDPRDLVYSGGYARNPQEILGNPAVAPQMLSEGQDLQDYLFQDSEDE